MISGENETIESIKTTRQFQDVFVTYVQAVIGPALNDIIDTNDGEDSFETSSAENTNNDRIMTSTCSFDDLDDLPSTENDLNNLCVIINEGTMRKKIFSLHARLTNSDCTA